jgi:hypothetical protein
LKIKENPSLSKNIPPKVHLELFGIFWNFFGTFECSFAPNFHPAFGKKRLKLKR